MKKNSKNSTSLYALIVAAIILVLSLGMFIVAISAWFVNSFYISGTTFRTGELEPQINISYWNTAASTDNKWNSLSVSQSDAFMYSYWGEITDITRLPEDCVVYLKIKVDELSDASYKYSVVVDEVQIKVSDSLLEPIDPLSIPLVSYYDATPSQCCFDFYFAIADDAANPQSLSFGASHQLLERKNSLTDNQFVPSNKWLYVKIVPRLTELQNIFKVIPTVFMPYNLEFWFNISGESRTIE